MGWVILFICTHLWKLQCYHVILIEYGPASPKLSEITNFQYLWKEFSGIEVSSWFFATKKLQNHTILGYGLKKLFANLFAEFFTFDLFDLLILISRGDCYIVFVYHTKTLFTTK